ncbi:sensor histidine kinase [Roseovarius aestuariivivens]|uniref:sensor histidine kinase n=1 Tax=Roseovarius aestuariivivens TaxID=1888910 RepID=UPI00107FD5E1|nr:HAMP domain-containing sensor histidine kinase [Roseovarius aestuariivivens]
MASGTEAEEFLYHLTHDLRAHVRALRVLPDWIDEDLAAAGVTLPAGVGEHIAMLRDYANMLDRMLNALTDLSRVGRLADAPGPVPLWPLLREIWSALPHAAGFTLDLKGDPPVVLGPRNDLARAFEALLRNAVDHHHMGGGHVEVSAHRSGARVLLWIEDDGPGIAPELRAQVFKPLQSLKPRSETGLAGIGLAIARKVVEQASGRISLVDPIGTTGCAVTVDLPLDSSG